MGVEEQGITLAHDRYRVVPRTLIFISHGDKILLIKGAPTKKIWPDLYNGVGGHVEANETIFEAAQREITEETGLQSVNNLSLRGTINIETDNPLLGIVLFVFTAECDEPRITSSDEGSLHWIDLHNMETHQMVPDIPVLISRLFSSSHDNSEVFHAKYWYDENDMLQMKFS